MDELLNTVTLLGALQGFGLTVALWRRRENHLAGRVLAALVAGLSLMLLLAFLERRWAPQGYPHLIALGTPLPYLFNPLLCLYVLALTRPIERFDPRLLVHGLPFLAFVAYMTQGFFLHPGDAKLAIIQAYRAGDVPPAMYGFHGVQLLQAVGYLSVAFVALRRHARRMAGYFSELSRIDLRWLAALVGANALIWAVVVLQALVQLVTGGQGDSAEPLVQVLSALLVFFIGYLFLWQPELTHKARAARVVDAPITPPPPPPPPVEPPAEPAADAQPPAVTEPAPAKPPVDPPADAEPPATAEPARPKPRYERNRLDPDEVAELVAGLERLMADEARYREPGLTLQDLADGLATPAHGLSQVLNVHVGRTFHAFVNGYRAEALKAALADPAQADRKVLDLAFDVGFGSKSTVNSVFKKHTGMTPTQYRRQALVA